MTVQPSLARDATAANPESFVARVAARVRATGGALCLGLDPDPRQLPPGFAPDARGLEAFARLVLDAAAPFAVAVKPNLAFYEALGADGLRVLERVRAAIPAAIPTVADAKRGDIGTTAERQAVAILDHLGFDAVTLNPYLGRDALEPFFARSAAFVIALCRTSNASAGVLQNALVAPDGEAGWPEEPLHLRVARAAATWAPPERLGFVVGATAPAELAAVRATTPDRAFLVPGIGRQGGDLDAVLRDGPARSGTLAELPGGGLLVNVSRDIADAWKDAPGTDPGEAIAARAAEWARKIAVLT